MKSISRNEVLRWISGPQSQGGSGGGGGSVDLAGYATQIWTEQNYVNKEFFSSLFKAYDANGNEVLPNDTETVIDNIKAMFGFWTDFYISALGTGGQSSLGIRLAQLADVNVAGVTNGQVLTYDTATQKWIASTPQAGTDMATVWANLAAADNTKQIDYSHLSGAVSLSNGTITIGSASITPLTQSTGDNRYLKLSGGTMTGTLGLRSNAYGGPSGTHGLNCNNSDIVGVNSIYTNDYSDGWEEGIEFYRSNGNWDSFRAANGNFYMQSDNGQDGACLHVNRLVLSCTTDASGDSANSVALITGNSTGTHLEFDGNEIMAKASGTTTGPLYLNANGGSVVINESAGNCGIGSTSLSYKLNVDGVIYSNTGVYSAGYVTALSDARHKDVIGDTGLTVEDIAKAPAIRFTWKDRDDKTVFAGSIAQYWQKVLPEVVQSQADDTLSLDYQVAALISSITVARKVMNHESRLQRLERMFAINENNIED